MINLTQQQMQQKVSFENLIRHWAKYFRPKTMTGKLKEDDISALAERLVIKNLRAEMVDKVIGEFLDQDDTVFPSVNEIAGRIANQPDHRSLEKSEQTIRDENEFKKRMNGLKSSLGDRFEEGVASYFSQWLKASSIEQSFVDILGKSMFLRLAISDLVMNNGKIERALKSAKASAELNNNKLNLESRVFQNKEYLVYRGKDARSSSFALKGAVS